MAEQPNLRLMDTSDQSEVLTSLEARSVWANQHHHECERAVGAALEHAIAAGEQLSAAKAEFSQSEIQSGKWSEWLAGNFSGTVDTAGRYMRLFRNRHELEVPRSGSEPLSIKAALRALSLPNSPPKEEKPANVEDSHETEPDQTSIETEDNEQELAARVAEREERLEALQKQLDDAQAREKAAKDTAKEAKKLKKEAKEATDKLEEERKEHKAERDRLAESNKQAYEKQLAEIYARHDIEEAPKFLDAISDMDEQQWRQLLSETKSKRDNEALKVLKDALHVAERMMAYEPAEAARKFQQWPSPGRAKDSLEQMLDWLSKTNNEIEAQTMPGKLRAVDAVHEPQREE